MGNNNFKWWFLGRPSNIFLISLIILLNCNACASNSSHETFPVVTTFTVFVGPSATSIACAYFVAVIKNLLVLSMYSGTKGHNFSECWCEAIK